MPTIISKSYENSSSNSEKFIFIGQPFIKETVVHPKGNFIRYLIGCLYEDDASTIIDATDARPNINGIFTSEGPLLGHDQSFACQGIDQKGVYLMLVKHVSSIYN